MEKTNHLIIGLGGTGGKIIRALRKMIYRNSKTSDPESVNIQYFYIDSSDEMMKLDDPSWKILGQSVQLKRDSQLLISGANLNAILDNINNYPGIAPWIGDKSLWRTILNISAGAKILGGQKRRLGRFLFACNMQKFEEQLTQLVRKMTEGGNIKVTFHVCAGLAGGTGSGSLIDVLSHLRRIYSNSNNSNNYKTLVYAMLPDQFPKPHWNTGNYHANGYAALMELNALSCGTFSPCDISGKEGRLKGLKDPFHCCYLFTNENENGLSVDVEKELPEVVATLLYRKIVGTVGVVWDSLDRAENYENRDPQPELAPGSSNEPERSRRFLAFGIKQLSYPEEEITEYISYSFARQAALQLAFNNWSDSIGYLDEPTNTDFSSYVTNPASLSRWKMTDAHLCLSAPIIVHDDGDDAKRWKEPIVEWGDFITLVKQDIRSQADVAWIDELHKKCEDRYNTMFRKRGVVKFFDDKKKNRLEYAKQIRGIIEDEMFSGWKGGTHSMSDLARLLDALIPETQTRWKEIDGTIEKCGRLRDEAARKVEQNKKEWAKVGPLGRFVGKPDAIFDASAANVAEYYGYATMVEANQFAKQLLQELITQLVDLKNKADRAAMTIRESVEKFQESIDCRCNDTAGADFKRHIVRMYDPDAVRRITSTLLKDEETQQAQTGVVRAALVELLGHNPSITKFSDMVTVSQFLDTLATTCAEAVKVAHEKYIERVQEKDKRLLRVSIIEKLRERYGGDDHSLRKDIETIVKQAGTFLPLNPAEKQMQGPGASGNNCIATLSIMMPPDSDDPVFAKKLVEEFDNAHPGGKVEPIISEDRPHEITLVTITSIFPLRFIHVLAFLRASYLARVKSQDGDRAKLELHIEGDGSDYPQLFVPRIEEVGLPLLILAKVAGLIQEAKDDLGKSTKMLLVSRESTGLEQHLELGSGYEGALVRLVDATVLKRVNDQVAMLMDQRETKSAQRRQELVQKIVAESEVLKAQRGIGDEFYQQFLVASKSAVNRINTLA